MANIVGRGQARLIFHYVRGPNGPPALVISRMGTVVILRGKTFH
jgi:hypothetical protein